MAMEITSDADRIDANSAAMAQIELEVIAPLELGFKKFDSLAIERARLESEVKRAAGEETAILNDEDLSEKDSVAKLLKTRAFKDVMTARLGAAQRRLEEQRFTLLESCSNLRRRLGTVVHHLRAARVKRATATITDLFETPIHFGPIGMGDLVRKVRFVREIDQVINRISGQNLDQQIELDTSRQLARAWFEEVQSVVLNEPGFSLRDYSPKQVAAEIESQPIAAEQPGELVEA
jgi:hypothetical protein